MYAYLYLLLVVWLFYLIVFCCVCWFDCSLVYTVDGLLLLIASVVVLVVYVYCFGSHGDKRQLTCRAQ